MVALVVLRDQVIRPLLAASGKLTPRPKVQTKPGSIDATKTCATLCDSCSWTSDWWRSRSTKDFTCDPSKMPVRC
jgi:hypothetical protein